MAYTDLTTKTSSNTAASADVNTLSDNQEVMRSGQFSGVKTVSSENFTFTENDGYGVALVTTGNSDRTIKLNTTSTFVKTVTKADAGTGDVLITDSGDTQLFKLENIGDSITFIGATTSWTILYSNRPLWAMNSAWLVTYESAAYVVAANPPSSGSWYNPASHSVSLVAGTWKLRFQVSIDVQNLDGDGSALGIAATISTANNSGVVANTVYFQHRTSGAGGAYLTKEIILTPTGTTTYYLNLYLTTEDSMTSTTLTTFGAFAGTSIRAERIK